MAKPLNPKYFNIAIPQLTDADFRYMKEVTVTDIFETSSDVFRKGGLFDTEIFGPVGSSLRNEQMAYIDLGLPILHPFVYENLIALNVKYNDLIEGKKYGYFDTKEKDLMISTDGKGSTGYTFVIDNIHKIQFKDRGSDQRRYRIDLVEKFSKKEYMFTKWLVLPAGLRDYVVNDKGVPSEDEVNNLYRKLIAVCAMVKNTRIGNNYAAIDPIRLKIQKTTLEIFNHFKNLLDGKDKFIQGKFAKRSVTHGTRNVITPIPQKIKDLKAENNISSIHTTVGLYQYIKSVGPIAMNRVSSMFINNILSPNNTTAYLVDPVSMETKLVEIPVKKRDQWLSTEGLTEIMNKLSQTDLRKDPVMIDKYYLMLLYDNGKEIRLYLHTEHIEDDVDRKKLRPITYAELFYIAMYDVKDKYPAFVTRYPITGLGSIIPTKIYVKTTTTARTVKFKFGSIEKEMKEYPILSELFIESLSVPVSFIGRLGADYDGDSVLGQCVGRFKKKNFKNTHYCGKLNNKEIKMPIKNRRVIYNYGLIDLKDFPKGNLIKKENNKEVYSVPDDLEILTVWNGEQKWVKPESYSIHKNLNMLGVKTTSGNTVECSDDHTIVTMDENLNYKRCNPIKGMTIPKLVNAVTNYVDPKYYKYTITSDGIKFNLNKDFGYFLGVIIGDGWVNHNEHKPSDIMLATIYDGIKDKITSVLREYGYASTPYTKENPHEFDGHKCFSKKHTWAFRPLANLLRKEIEHMAINKQLPEWWANTTTNFRWGLLSGLLDTDGTFAYGGERLAIRFATSSHKLAYDTISLINSLGGSAGLTVVKRKNKENQEFTIMVSTNFYNTLKENVMLFNEFKKERLFSSPKKNEKTHYYTPNIPLNQLLNIRSFLNYNKANFNMKNIVDDCIKKARVNGIGGYCQVERMMELLDYCSEFIKKDEYWSKLKNVLDDNKIVWELITSIIPLPHVTEAYDLTVPPYCTFVLQNGIIVYDTMSLNIVMTDESIKELNKYMDSPNAYLTPNGQITYSNDTDPIKLVMMELTE